MRMRHFDFPVGDRLTAVATVYLCPLRLGGSFVRLPTGGRGVKVPALCDAERGDVREGENIPAECGRDLTEPVEDLPLLEAADDRGEPMRTMSSSSAMRGSRVEARRAPSLLSRIDNGGFLLGCVIQRWAKIGSMGLSVRFGSVERAIDMPLHLIKESSIAKERSGQDDVSFHRWKAMLPMPPAMRRKL